MNTYGGLDLTLLRRLIEQQPNLVRRIQTKDGEHEIINIEYEEKQTPDQYNCIANIKATCRKEDRIEGVKYYLSNMKMSNYQPQQVYRGSGYTPTPTYGNPYESRQNWNGGGSNYRAQQPPQYRGSGYPGNPDPNDVGF